MGTDLSKLFSSDNTGYYDCQLKGYKYVIKGPFHMQVLICGQQRSGKSTLFRTFHQAISNLDVKKDEAYSSIVIPYKSPYLPEQIEIMLTDINYEKVLKKPSIVDDTYEEQEENNEIEFASEEYQDFFTQCDCLVFVADPRRKDIFESFQEMIQHVSINTTVLVLNNFIDNKEAWLYSSNEIQSRCQHIIDASKKCLELWVIDACLSEGYGLDELTLLLVQPFFQMKLNIIQNMMKKTARKLDRSRDYTLEYLQNSNYQDYHDAWLKKKQTKNDNTEETRSRDFVTLHSYYLHDHSNKQETVISTKKSNTTNYETISRSKVEDWRSLESGSDCDEISPAGPSDRQSQAVIVDPSVLNENLSEFLRSVNDEEMIKNIAESLDSMPVNVGIEKEVVEDKKEVNSDLITEAYPIPENYVPKEKEIDEPSFEELVGFSK